MFKPWVAFHSKLGTGDWQTGRVVDRNEVPVSVHAVEHALARTGIDRPTALSVRCCRQQTHWMRQISTRLRT